MGGSSKLERRWLGEAGETGIGGHLLANVVLGVGLLAFALVTWPYLPARYPVHFDGAGNPNRWASRESAEWLLLAAMGLTMVGMQIGLALALPRIPLRYWNVPRKRVFLALPPERQRPVIRVAQLLVLEVALGLLLILWATQLAILATAVGWTARPWDEPIVLSLALTLGLVGWRTWWLWRAVKRATAN